MESITQLVNGDGRGADAEAAYRAVYDELRRLAGRELRAESDRCTLEPTALVSEAFIRLMDGRNRSWESRAHFYGSAARAMRQVLVEHARQRNALKRGGGRARTILTESPSPEGLDAAELLNLDQALTELAAHDEQAAALVTLRYFAGLTVEETAMVLGISERTVKREWACARAWLYQRTSDGAREDRPR